jgi:hypothetical protein
MFVCLSSWDFTSQQCQPYVQILDLLIGLLALGTIVPLFWQWLFKYAINVKRNFKILFTNHPPLPGHPSPIDEPFNSIKELPPGSHRLLIKVCSSACGFQVQSINLRCIDQDGESNVSENIVEINSVEDFHHAVYMVDDGNGGIDCEYARPRSLAKGECLYFIFDLLAKTTWSGLLSFRAQDGEGLRYYARHSLRIVVGASLTPQINYPIDHFTAEGFIVRIMPNPGGP